MKRERYEKKLLRNRIHAVREFFKMVKSNAYKASTGTYYVAGIKSMAKNLFSNPGVVREALEFLVKEKALVSLGSIGKITDVEVRRALARAHPSLAMKIKISHSSNPSAPFGPLNLPATHVFELRMEQLEPAIRKYIRQLRQKKK